MTQLHGGSRRGGVRMRARPALRVLPALVGAALAQMAWLPAHADSGHGADTVLGNALNLRGSLVGREKDPDGLGEAENSRNPSGLLNARPWLVREPVRSESGWLLRSAVEVGGLRVGGDRDAARFGEYKSLESGLYLTHAQLEAERPADALYVDARVGGLGRDDQFAGVTLGRYNAWRVNAFYNETNHLHTSTYRNLWRGTGTGTLTLVDLPAGPAAPATAATTDVAIGQAALATPYSSLSVLRQKGGLRLDATLSDHWKAFATFTSERREGARPFALVMGAGGGTGGVEIPESIDYDTHEVAAGAQWHRGNTSVNLLASASLFRNNVDTMTVDNPMFLAPANGIAGFPRATFDLYPDNELYNLKAEIAHAMPELARARFTAVLSASSSRQNDALIPSTAYAGATVNGVAGGAWDTLDSLSRRSAGARIDTNLIDLGAAFAPAAGLDVKAKLRRYATRNDTEYWACNPLTGQWGRLTNDGSGASFSVPNATAGNNPAGTPATAFDAAMCDRTALQALGLVPSAGNTVIGSVPFEYTQTNASLGADYRFARAHNVSVAIERETFDRENRERDETWEDKVKLGYVNRALPGGTLRASLEHARRRGSAYVANPYGEYQSKSFGPTPTAPTTNVTSWIHVNDLHRKFDLADRDQSVLNLRFNHALRPDMDLAFATQLKSQDYSHAAYGRTGRQTQHSANVDVNWQPSVETSAYASLAFQAGRMKQQGLQQNACVLGSTYYLYSDGSINAVGTLTPAQEAAGITVVGNSGVVTGANFLDLCGGASPTSPLYPTSRSFTTTQRDRSTSLAIGGAHDFGRLRADANYVISRGRTGIGYGFNPAALGLAASGGATPAQLTTLGLIGTRFPDLRYEQQVLDASLLVPLKAGVKLRLLLRHEIGEIRDWHYDGVAANPTPAVNQQTYLDSGPADYEVTAVGVFVQVEW